MARRRVMPLPLQPTERVAHSPPLHEQRTSSQIRRAQAQAQLEVAADRQRHLSEEFTSATGRLETLQVELTTLSSADSQLTDQLSQWQNDLDIRQRTLENTEEKLADA